MSNEFIFIIDVLVPGYTIRSSKMQRMKLPTDWCGIGHNIHYNDIQLLTILINKYTHMYILIFWRGKYLPTPTDLEIIYYSDLCSTKVCYYYIFFFMEKGKKKPIRNYNNHWIKGFFFCCYVEEEE